ncbi:hypothetical protein [Aliiroseovarius subalbicans]|uniref:hypothetical protein n=1 Tax=Aliiroseovarius subalbicans TaxID=2925840 RepID=UPI001F573B65|nr:hypothetical protein [Aliiroseovarius subalbicans]MCI2400573.1 hypothetical protein [Aliiroseovarius subalbicans]
MQSDILAQSQITPALRDALFALYAAHYTPTNRAVFDADLARKSWVIVLRAKGEVVGFSTIELSEHNTATGPVRVLFSGDTILRRDHWGAQTLPMRWIEHAGRVKAERPDVPLFWLLISKGHRTYRYLPAFTYHAYPAPDEATPPTLAALMQELGTTRFAQAFDTRRGIVRPGACPTALRPEYAGEDTPTRNRHARFFEDRNPGHAKGEELLCLCELSVDNLRPRARAAFVRGLGA